MSLLPNGFGWKDALCAAWDRGMRNSLDMVKYLKDIYGVDADIAEIEYLYMLRKDWTNLYDDFNEKHPVEWTGNAKKDRETAVKRYYTYSREFDIRPTCFRGEVHHIFPLVFGGTNELSNLVEVGGTIHKLLHRNPKESNIVYAYRAVDYLHYITLGRGLKAIHSAYSRAKDFGVEDVEYVTMLVEAEVTRMMLELYAYFLVEECVV